MKSIITFFVMLAATLPACAVVNEGVVMWVDGKGAFLIATDHCGLLLLHAHADFMADELEFKTRWFPHRYRDIKSGDYISFSWQGGGKTGKNVAHSVGIKRRGA